MKNQTFFPEGIDGGDEEEEAWRSKVSRKVLVSSEKSDSMKRTGSGSKLDEPSRRRINSFSFDRMKNFSFETTMTSIFLGVGVGQEEEDEGDVLEGRNLSIERGEERGDEGGDGEDEEKADKEANRKLCG